MALTKLTKPRARWTTFKLKLAGAISRALYDKLTEHISVDDFGAVGDGVTDDTAAIQAAYDAVGAYSTVLFSHRKTYKFTKVDIKEPYVISTGGGTLNGTLRIYNKNYVVENKIDMLFRVEGLNFITDNASINAIELAYSRRGKILDNNFEGHNTAIRVVSTTTLPSPQTWGQHVNRVIVQGNHYLDVGYFIRVDQSPNISYSQADWIVTGNDGTAIYWHINSYGTDGITISDNIMFFAGYQTQDIRKIGHVFLQNSVWVQIHDNKFFEAGESSVVLSSCTRYTMHDNVYAWWGQRVEKPAVSIVNVPAGAAYFTQSSIHHELFIHGSGAGIEISAKQGRMQVDNNEFQYCGSTEYFYGTGHSGKKLAIDMKSNDVIDIKTNDNHARWCDYNLVDGVNGSCKHTNNILDLDGQGINVVRKTNLRTLTATSSNTISGVIDARGYDKVFIDASLDGTEITEIKSDNKILILKSFAPTVTIKHDVSKIILSGRTDAIVTQRDAMTFFFDDASNVANELSRALARDIIEAPIDGTKYARRNAGWFQFT